MPKLANLDRRQAVQAGTGDTQPAVTYEGGVGYTRTAELELFTLGVTFLFGEPAFYEAADQRADRFEKLITTVDPAFVAPYLRWLRGDGGIRTAALVGAVLYARAHPGTDGRTVVDQVCQRADEPAEVLAYARHRYGNAVPQAVIRGVADAARRLYTETSYLKWDSARAAFRMGDVLQLTHPRPTAAWQAALFSAIVDRRVTGGDRGYDSEVLPTLASFDEAQRVPYEQRVLRLTFDDLPRGFTWEDTLSWAPSDMKREAWELVIPRMGVTALLRNLRNFDQAEIGADAVAQVCNKLSSVDDVRASRVFPHQVFAASKAAQSDDYRSAVSKCLDHATGNVPEFRGRTLVMVDTSGSMGWTALSGRGTMTCADVAGVFGAAVAKRNSGRVHLWAYASTTAPVQVGTGRLSALSLAERVKATEVGGGTNTWPSVAQALAQVGPVDRVMILTDGQAHPAGVDHTVVPCPIYSWNLAGYPVADLPVGAGRYQLGGFSDAAFRVVPLLERGADTPYPWEL